MMATEGERGIRAPSVVQFVRVVKSQYFAAGLPTADTLALRI